MKAKTTEEFIKEAKLIHGDKYDYSLTNYVNNKTKIKVICPIHGVFEQRPDSHLKNFGCSKCGYKKMSQQEFIDKANKIHNNKYNYSETIFENIKLKVKIVCPIHGVFEQNAHSHLSGEGCPKCKSSKGETIIRNYLKENNILFEEQKRYKECKNERTLPFDFYIPKKNLLIEYNGSQHYEEAEFFGGKEKFNKQQKNDELKRKFAKDNKINLLTISYKDYNIIEKILEENLWQK